MGFRRCAGGRKWSRSRFWSPSPYVPLAVGFVCARYVLLTSDPFLVILQSMLSYPIGRHAFLWCLSSHALCGCLTHRLPGIITVVDIGRYLAYALRGVALL